MKETIESILVAFILAFIFRAFVVEAFVIPTGSMAPTLLGAHMRFRCQDCGYGFDTNYTAPSNSAGDLIIESRSKSNYHVNCPNCGYKIPEDDPAEPDNDASSPPVHYGDRILVLKYLYLLNDPQRWDVVVFKSPEREPNGDAPTYTQNYIKRLIGRPGESILILDGNIYTGAPGAEQAAFQIARKPSYVQDALWRVIYDNDYLPQGVERSGGGRWKQPWTVREGTGWDVGAAGAAAGAGADGAGAANTGAAANRPAGERVFRFDNAGGASTLYFDRDANPGNKPFTDWLAYDMDHAAPAHVVRDLKVAFHYAREAGDGALRVHLGDGRQTFAAVITPDQAALVEAGPSGDRAIGAAKLPVGNGPVRVEMVNADYQVTLRINGEVVARTSDTDYRPDIARLLADFAATRAQPWPTVEIIGERQTASLSHVGLWRDVYYLNRDSRRRDERIYGNPRNVINLGPEEYFVLGDNSLLSGDARFWEVPIELSADQLSVPAGRVPARFMLGRAFFVYWPAGFRPAPLVPALSPNFGDMRFIR